MNVISTKGPDSTGKNKAGKKTDRVIATQKAIEEMIRDGEIKTGDRFPPERVFAERLDVSRNTVREALNSLEALGIIKTIQGSGRYLAEQENIIGRVLSTRHLVEKYTYLELVETRRVVEIGIIRLAAARATREDKIKLQECYREMKAMNAKGTGYDMDLFEKLDYQFHYEIACISGNSILREIMGAMQGLIHVATRTIRKNTDASSHAEYWHGQILEAIADNDVNRATDAMTKHLASVEELLMSGNANTEGKSDW